MQSLKSIAVVIKKHHRCILAMTGIRTLRLDNTLNRPPRDTKISATVRTSALPENTSTELVPQEIKKPSELALMVVCNNKRNELEQRKLRRMEYEANLIDLKTSTVEAATSGKSVQCVPFVRDPKTSHTSQRRRYDSPEELLKQVSDPMELAKEVVRMARQLFREKDKYEIMYQDFLALKEKMMLKKDKDSNAAEPRSTSFFTLDK
ncbi:hypothetical protein KR018_006806 [Drosophila ironensis]|nr:hypothetical protein KR018_006806 [Drosophila ironensis]